VVALVEERLAKISTSLLPLMGRVNNMDKSIKELESEGDMKEL